MVRDDIVRFVEQMSKRTSFSRRELLDMIDIRPGRYYEWKNRLGQSNQHNGQIPKSHWITDEERRAIRKYCKDKLEDGYRRLSYMMLDEDIAAVSPSTTYRVLKEADLLNRWSRSQGNEKPGFTQPIHAHQHWHTDISYVNILGSIFFLITVLDGYSRYVVAHDLRSHMSEYDVEVIIQQAKEAFPDARPRIISDNGPQFISKDFKEFIRNSGFTHVRTRPYYPQSNGKLEKFHGTIKSEEIRRQSYISLEDARKRIAGYIDHYNTKRLHSAIKFLTPEDMLKDRMVERLTERQRKMEQAKLRRLEWHKSVA